MAIIIVNLSDILNVKLNESKAAFIKLRKENTQRLCGIANVAPTLFGVTDLAYVNGALMIANLSTIPKYRKGEISTDYFINNCLLYHFPKPVNFEGDWMQALVSAWNIMIQANEEKIEQFASIETNQDEFFLITNSNDLHLQKICDIFNDKGLNFKFDETNNCLINHGNLSAKIISSHLTHQFKTTGMIEDLTKQIINHKPEEEIIVCSSYVADCTTATNLGLKTVTITANFDYANLNNYLGIEANHFKNG